MILSILSTGASIRVSRRIGLVIGLRTVHDGLPGQAGAQIALRAGHNSQAADHVVINFAAAAVDLLIHRGKIVLHVDPLADYLRTGHDGLEQPAVRVAAIIVGVEKDPSVKIDAASERATPDDKSRITRQAPFRPDLAPIAAPAPDFPPGFRSAQGRVDFGEAGAALLNVPRACPLEVADQLQQVLAMGRRKIFEIEEIDLVGGRVVLSGDEIGILRNRDAVLGQLFAYQGFVGHDRDHPRVGLAGVAAAGAAVEGGFKGIVLRAAAVAAKEHETGEVSRQAHDSERGFHGQNLLAGA